MGKASRNARNNLAGVFARLHKSGKSLWQIAVIAKCDPKIVFLHYSPDGGGRRRNEGFVRFLRENGAHWTLIAAAQGMTYDEIKELDSSGMRPNGPWLQGLTLISSVEDPSPDEVVIDDELSAENDENSEEPSESEMPDSMVFEDGYSGSDVNDFVEGQKVRLTEDSVAARAELIPFSSGIVIIVHIDGDQILIKKASEEELSTVAESSDHQIVSPNEIIAVIDTVDPRCDDEVTYTKVGHQPRLAKVLAIQHRDNETTYSLILRDDSSYAFASRAEIEVVTTKPASAAVDQKFYFKDAICDAVGIADERGGITVLKGSKGKRKTSKGKTGRENICNDRLELFEEGKVKVMDEAIELVENHYFPSFHRALSGIMGYNTSGQNWKTADGKTYSQVQLERSAPEELFVV